MLLCGCYSKFVSFKTFTDPSIQTSSIKTVAIFQMRNTAFSPGETMELDRTVTQDFISKNSSVKLIGTSESNELLNKENLASEFSQFLQDFEHSGIPNTVFLNKLKSKFDIDAIFQGRLSEVKCHDKNNEGKAQTSFTIRYTLLSTKDGTILWEGTSNVGIIYGKTKGSHAPPFNDVADLAKDKITSSIPYVGK